MASGDLGKLIVRIEAELSQLKAGLGQALNLTKNFVKGGQSTIKSFSSSWVNLASQIYVVRQAITALKGAYDKIIGSSLAYGMRLNEMNRLMGISEAKFGALTYAVEQEHGSVQALTRAFPTLAQRMTDASSGLETYAREFRRLNIEYKNSDGTMRNVDEVLLDMADSMKNASDKTEALGSLTKILGLRVAKDLIPFLKLGSGEIKNLMNQYTKLIGMTDTQIEQFSRNAKLFDDKLTELKTQFRGVGMIITASLLPAMNTIVDEMRKVDWAKVADDITRVASSFLDMSKSIAKVTEAVGFASSWWGTLVYGQMNKNASSMFSGVGLGISGLGSNIGLGGLGNVGMGGISAGAGAGQGISGAVGGITSGAIGSQSMIQTPQAVTSQGTQSGAQGGAGGEQGSKSKGGLDALTESFDAFMDKLQEAQDKTDEFKGQFVADAEELAEIFKGGIQGMFDVFSESFAGMIVQGQSFTEAIKQGFESLATQFVASIVKMIAQWTAFIGAIMAIAIVLAFFGVSIGDTFKTAFKLVQGEKGSTGSGFGDKMIKSAIGSFFRDGGAILQARDGLAFEGMGIRATGAYGESGIPVVAHPNEAILRFDQLESMMNNLRPINLTVNGYNRDQRELAEAIGWETVRKRRSP